MLCKIWLHHQIDLCLLSERHHNHWDKQSLEEKGHFSGFLCSCLTQNVIFLLRRWYSDANIPLSKPLLHINWVSLSLWDLPVFAVSYKPVVKWHAVKTELLQISATWPGPRSVRHCRNDSLVWTGICGCRSSSWSSPSPFFPLDLNSDRQRLLWTPLEIYLREECNAYKNAWDITCWNQAFSPFLIAILNTESDFFFSKMVPSWCVNTVPVFESLNAPWQTAIMWSKYLSAWQASKTGWRMNNARLCKHL